MVGVTHSVDYALSPEAYGPAAWAGGRLLVSTEDWSGDESIHCEFAIHFVAQDGVVHFLRGSGTVQAQSHAELSSPPVADRLSAWVRAYTGEQDVVGSIDSTDWPETTPWVAGDQFSRSLREWDLHYDKAEPSLVLTTQGFTGSHGFSLSPPSTHYVVEITAPGPDEVNVEVTVADTTTGESRSLQAAGRVRLSNGELGGSDPVHWEFGLFFEMDGEVRHVVGGGTIL
jgi:hypothetical protein